MFFQYKKQKMEEGDNLVPISGDIETNFGGIEAERKKQLRNKIIMWAAVGLGVIIIVIIIILLALNGGSGNGEGEGEEDDGIPKEIYGDITCIFDVFSGEIDILSEEFEYQKNLVIYLGNQKINFTKKYNF